MRATRLRSSALGWPANALRDSFASYHLARFENAAKLAIELGHTDQELLFRHCRELVTPQDAERYWNTFPARTAENVVPMEQAS